MLPVLPELAALLACPNCRSAVEPADRTLVCERGHSFDIARQGYVSLLTGAATKFTGDTAPMIEARERFLDAGHFDPIADLLVDTIATPELRILEIGAGTGHYLSDILDADPESLGVGIDISKPAARRLARAHRRCAAVVADAWQQLPIRDRSLTRVLSVFAPRNAAEIDRVLSDDGMFVVVTPTPAHLRELIGPLGMIAVDDEKPQRLAAALSGLFERIDRVELEYPMALTHADIDAVVGMGPSAHHRSAAALADRIAELPDETDVTASVLVSSYRPRRSTASS